MKIYKYLVLAGVMLILLVLGIMFFLRGSYVVWHKTIKTDDFGPISVAYPFFGQKKTVLAFIDINKFDAKKLSDQIAQLGADAVIVDVNLALKVFTKGAGECLDSKRTEQIFTSLMNIIPISDASPLVVTGINDGAWIPFLNAASVSKKNITNLSIGFSGVLPSNLTLCPPFITDEHHELISSPDLVSHWRSVWIGYPESKTGTLVRSIAQATTWIATYETSLDTVLINELKKLFGKTDELPTPIPVVEIPRVGINEVVTLFYSGDGGWRDLDRTIAEQMVKEGYPAVGIDTLRVFWNRKTPEQATADLAATMAYYRTKWGAKSFVLAGYSFGADIIPVIYNRLSTTDQDSIRLLVMLALSKEANFEISVTGWLVKDALGLKMAPELAKLPKNKILCIYGKEEKAESACMDIASTPAALLELPGGHHFDEDYPKLTRLILDKYNAVGITSEAVTNQP
jgi:type IV secretory pathway VirJ component